MSCVALSRPELINHCRMNQHSKFDFTWRIHLIRSWTSLLNNFPSCKSNNNRFWPQYTCTLTCRVVARLGLGYLTVPRYIRRETILTNSSSWPALASSNLMTSPPGNSWPKSLSICVQVSEAVLLEKLHDWMYFVMYWAKNLPEKLVWNMAVVINYYPSWNTHHQSGIWDPLLLSARDWSPTDNRLLTNCLPLLTFCHFLQYNFWKFPFWTSFLPRQ